MAYWLVKSPVTPESKIGPVLIFEVADNVGPECCGGGLNFVGEESGFGGEEEHYECVHCGSEWHQQGYHE